MNVSLSASKTLEQSEDIFFTSMFHGSKYTISYSTKTTSTLIQPILYKSLLVQ